MTKSLLFALCNECSMQEKYQKQNDLPKPRFIKQNLGFPVIDFTQISWRDMETKEKFLYPLFLVTVPKSIDIKELFELRYLISYRISIENH